MEDEEIQYHMFLNGLCVIKNVITLICFTLLAILFGKWWIVLFAILFHASISETKERER